MFKSSLEKACPGGGGGVITECFPLRDNGIVEHWNNSFAVQFFQTKISYAT